MSEASTTARGGVLSAGVRSQLLFASLLRLAPGIGLSAAGAVWLFEAHGRWGYLLIVPFLALGLLKGILLDRLTHRAVERIRARGRAFLLGAISPGTWALIAVMMAGGYFLRHSGLPLMFLGLLYLAIGFALVLSSRGLFRAWRAEPKGA